MVEEVLTKTPSRDHHEIAVDTEVAKLASENLTAYEGHDTIETAACVTRDDAKEGERARCDFSCVGCCTM
jgi:hypothetical protein